MMSPRPIPIPDGLPAHFDGPAGYKRLCQFLGATTSKAQAELARELSAKAGGGSKAGKPGGRKKMSKGQTKEVIVGFYRNPGARLMQWNRIVQSPKGPSKHTHSFEWQALSRFLDQHVSARDWRSHWEATGPLSILIGGLCAAVPRNPQELSERAHWLAVCAWEPLEELTTDILHIDSSQKESISEVTLAIATILEDARVIQWFIGKLPALRKQLSFVPPGMQPSDWELFEQFRKPSKQQRILDNWSLGTREIVRIGQELDRAHHGSASQPHAEIDTFSWGQQMVSLVYSAARLQQLWPDRYTLYLATRPEVVAEQVGSEIQRVAEVHGAQWLALYAPRVRALWKLAYHSRDLKDMQLDLKRMRKGLDHAAREWKRAQLDDDKARDEQRDLDKSLESDPLNVALADQLVSVRERRFKAQAKKAETTRELLTAIAPQGRPFVSGEDYEEEWNALATKQRDNADTDLEGTEKDPTPDHDPDELSSGLVDDLFAIEKRRLGIKIAELKAKLVLSIDDNRALKRDLKLAKKNMTAMSVTRLESSPAFGQTNGWAPDSVDSVEKVCKYARDRWSNQLALGVDVDRGLKQLHPNAGPPSKVMTHLAGLATYCDMQLGGRGDSLGMLDWLKSQNIDVSPLRKGALGHEYHDPIRGERHRFEMHTKPNSHTSHNLCVRIYFRYDRDRNIVSIGWIGPHPN